MERAPVFGYHVDLLQVRLAPGDRWRRLHACIAALVRLLQQSSCVRMRNLMWALVPAPQRKLVARIVSRHMCLCGPATYTIKAARGKSLLFDPSPHGSVSSGAAHAATPKAAGEQQAHQRRDGGSSHTLRSGSLLTRQCSSAGVPHGVYEYPCIERLFDDDAGSTVTGAHLAAPAAQHMPPAAAAAGAAANGGLKQLSVVLPEPCKDYASVAFADQRGGGGAASPGGASPGGASSVMSAFSLDRLPSFVSSHGKWVWWGFRLRELGFLAAFVQVRAGF